MELVQAMNFASMAEEELREAQCEVDASEGDALRKVAAGKRWSGAVEGFNWSLDRLMEAAKAARVEVVRG